MKAYEIMVKDVCSVNELNNVQTVIKKFIKHGISGLPIVNLKNEIVAYVSDGDIMQYLAKQDNLVADIFDFVTGTQKQKESIDWKITQLLELNILLIATSNVIAVAEDTDIEEIASIMSKKKIKKLPVVNKEGVLVGIISRGDVIRRVFKSVITSAYSN